MASSSSVFTIGGAISYGWKSVKGNLKLFVPLVLVVVGITITFQLVQALLLRNEATLLSTLVSLIYVFVQLLIALGLIRVVINFVSKKKASVSELFGESRLVLRYFLSTILVAVPVWIAFGVGASVIVFLILGGEIPFYTSLEATEIFGTLSVVGLFVAFVVYWQIKMQFYSYFMVDKNTGPVESLKKSFGVTNGYFWKLFWLGLLLGLVNLLGLLVLVVGLAITIPIDWVTRAHVYKKLSS